MIKYFVVLLMLVLISFFTIYTRHEKEKARQEERARQEQLVALKEQQREEQRVKEAQKRFEEKMAREKEMQELAEKKRLEREAAKQAAEKKAAEEKNQEEIRLAESAKIEACNKIRRKLSGARLLPWKMLKAQDRPESSSGEKTFYFVFPEDQLGGRMFLELKTVSGRPVALQRLDGNKSSERNLSRKG